MNSREARKYIKEILKHHGFDNKFRVFSMDFADMGGSAMFVEIKDWKPDPIYDTLKKEIKQKTGAILT